MSEVTDLLISIASKASIDYVNLLSSSKLNKFDFQEIIKTFATKSEVNEAFLIKANASQTQTALDLKANRSEVYSVSETISLLEAFVGAKVVRTITERDALEAGIYRYVWVIDPSADANIENKLFPALYMWHTYDRITGSYMYMASAIQQLDLGLLDDIIAMIGTGFSSENTIASQLSAVKSTAETNTSSIATLSTTIGQHATQLSSITVSLTEKADLSGAAFTGPISVSGVLITPSTQLTIDQKAAMSAANTPSATNPIATIADLRDPNDLGWFADEAALKAAFPTTTNGKHAILGSTDTVWIWDSDTSDYSDSGKKGAVSSVNGYTGAILLGKSDLGLEFVNNTSDMDKPISTAVQAALDAIQGISSITVDTHYFVGDGTVENPLQLSEDFLSDFLPSIAGLSYIDDGRILYASYDTGIDSYTKCLLHFDNAVTLLEDASVNATIGSLVDAYGEENAKFGSGSCHIGGTYGFVLDLPAMSGDWTTDFWFSWQSGGGGYLRFDGSQFIPFFTNSQAEHTFGTHTIPQSLVGFPAASQIYLSNNTWYHLAFEQYGTKFRVYFNGNMVHESTTTVTFGAGLYDIRMMDSGSSCLIDEMRVSAIARYTSDSFTPASDKYGTPVISYALSTTKINDLLQLASTTTPGRMSAIDKAKLDGLTGDPAFPDSPNVGDLMTGKSGADLGNNATTMFLLEPEASNGEFVDIAFGTSAPVPLTNNGLTLTEDNYISFTTDKNIVIPANSLPLDVLVPDHEWTIDVVVKITDGGTAMYHPFFGVDNNHPVFFTYDQPSGKLRIRSDAGTTEYLYVLNTFVHMTLEYFYDASAGYYREARYVNGVLLAITGNASLNGESTRAATWYVGYVPPYVASCYGIIRSIRIRNVAPYRGVSFTPQALPWVSSGPNFWAKTSLADVKSMMDQISGAERRITINTGSFTGTRHLLLEISSHADYSVVETLINTETESDNRSAVYAVSSTGNWATCPATGFPVDYQNSVVYVVLDNSIDLDTKKYVRYKWFNSGSVLSYTLTNAGSTDVNDTFYPAEAADVTNYYGTTLDNIWMSSDKTCQMFKDTANYYSMDGDYWVIVGVADNMPYYVGGGATPDVAAWYVYTGTDPVPSVAANTSVAVDDGWNYTVAGSMLLQPIVKASNITLEQVQQEAIKMAIIFG